MYNQKSTASIEKAARTTSKHQEGTKNSLTVTIQKAPEINNKHPEGTRNEKQASQNC
jgi:hypothetical protein